MAVIALKQTPASFGPANYGNIAAPRPVIITTPKYDTAPPKTTSSPIIG